MNFVWQCFSECNVQMTCYFDFVPCLCVPFYFLYVVTDQFSSNKVIYVY